MSQSVSLSKSQLVCISVNQSVSQSVFLSMYRVFFKKVSFGVFRIILVSKEEKNFTVESKDKGLSLSKFS